MNIEKFLRATNRGEIVDKGEILNYIKTFKKVIIWGAAALGKSVGAYLLSQGIDFEEYWDLRSDEIKELNGKRVVKPFMAEYDRDTTLLVYCISNLVISGVIRKHLADNNYFNNLSGFNLFMAVLCPSDIKRGLNMESCIKSASCLKIYCSRMMTLFAHERTVADKEYPLHIDGITLVINQKCNLSCKHCTSYMNAYSKSDQVNFPKDDIIRDIHNFMSSVDSVASMTVMGGEPFMHPDISEIMQALLGHKNIGFISISTNGVYPIKPEQLPGLLDDRVVVAFNNYLPSLPAKLQSVFDANVDIVKKSGAHYSVGRYMPEWRIPSTLYNVHLDFESMKEKKKKCDGNDALRVATHHQLKNGRLYPCDFSNALHCLKVADYPNDYVYVSDVNDLRKRLYEHYHADYYFSCGHCRGTLGPAGASAAQGKLDFIIAPPDVDKLSYIPGEL